MSRRSNVLGGVGVEVSPSAASTINNIVTISNTPSYPTVDTSPLHAEGPSTHQSPFGTVDTPDSLREPQQTPDNPYSERSLETAEQRKESIEALTS